MLKRSLLAALMISSTLVACSTPQASFFQSAQSNLGTFSANRNANWFAQLPFQQKQYYGPAEGKTGAALFTSLHKIIRSNQRALSYGGARSFMYGTADQIRIQNTNGLLASYSNVLIKGSSDNGNRYKEPGDLNKDGKSGDFINCEHTWPQSFFGKRAPMVSDMHHLFPTLSKPNSMRNNHPIGMATGVIVYTTSGGSKLGVIDKTGKHNPNDIRQWYNMPWNQQPHDIMRRDLQATFEPLNSQKGNTARAMLYFYLRYYNENIRQKAFKQDIYWNKQVNTYIQWAKADPVDENERRRHDLVAKKQNNRNPFIDIPNLAEAIGEEIMIKGPRP